MNDYSRIIVALESTTKIEDITKLVRTLAPKVKGFKIELELMRSLGGPQIVKLIHELDSKVFYDGRPCDIPDTIGASAEAISELTVEMIHARPEWASLADEKRVITPAEAIKAGAIAVVIGCPITNPPKEIGSPINAAISINIEVTEALREMARSSKK
jgi:orotidine-5'-phosphate decarboxylase